MPETSPADVGSLPAPKRPYEKKPFPDEGRPVIGGPSTIAEFESGREPKNIFARSFDGPLNHAWSLLKFVNKRKYAQMAPEDSDSQPGGVYQQVPPTEDLEPEEEEGGESLIDETYRDDPNGLQALLQLLGENPDERSPARGLSNLQDPFRMKRPEMEDEMSDMGEEETRRLSPEMIGSRWPAKDWHGLSEIEGEMPQFSMDKPEMGERRQSLQSEIARRGKPALQE
jgi:hypothetical protein